jgi:hypothetical protein
MEQSDHHLVRIALQANQSQVQERAFEVDWFGRWRGRGSAIDFTSNEARKKQIDASRKELLDIS